MVGGMSPPQPEIRISGPQASLMFMAFFGTMDESKTGFREKRLQG